MSLGRQLLRGSGMNVLELGAKTVAVFITTPVIIQALGLEGYGTWIIIMTVLGYYVLIDMGVTFSATRFLAISVGAKDFERQAVVIQAAQRFYKITAWGLALATLIVAPLIPYFFATPSSHLEMSAALGLCGLSMVLRFSCRLPTILLRANVRYDLQAIASLARTLFQTPVVCWAVINGWGIMGIAVAQFFGECLELGFQWFFSRRFVSSISYNKSSSSEITTRSLFAYSRSITLGMVGDSLRKNLNPFLITGLYGVASVPLYSIGLRLVTILQDVANALFGGPVLSAFGHLHGADQTDELKAAFLRVTKLASAFSAMAVVATVWLSPVFLERWVGPEMAKAASLMAILAVGFGIHFSQLPAYNLLYTLGHTDWVVKICFFGGAFSGLLSFVLAFQYGIHGIVLGSSIEMTLSRGVLMPWLVHRCLGISVTKYIFHHVLWPAVKSLFLPGLLIVIWADRLEPRYFDIFVAALAYSIVCIPGALFFVMTSQDRDKLRTLIYSEKKSREEDKVVKG